MIIKILVSTMAKAKDDSVRIRTAGEVVEVEDAIGKKMVSEKLAKQVKEAEQK